MANTFFKFKSFTVQQDRCAMKVTTDACLFGAWVAGKIESEKSEMQNGKILDIGTGTGLLSLMIAQKNNCRVDAFEIDPGAAEQAMENIAASPWKEQIFIHQADIRGHELAGKYDVIVSNPPFYEKELMSPDIKINLARHGQELSLDGLFPLIARHLLPEGNFFLLLPYKRIEEIRSLLSTNKLQIVTEVSIRQTIKHEPFRVLISGSLSNESQGDTTTNEITIWDENKRYSPEFAKLLKDYYLAL